MANANEFALIGRQSTPVVIEAFLGHVIAGQVSRATLPISKAGE